MSNYSDTVEGIRGETYGLTSRADCMAPDDLESPGARFLARVRDDALERADYLHDEADDAADFERLADDVAHEIADSAVPIYTAARWAVFTDLGAWAEEELDELAGPDDDMTQRAAVALYCIARRLAGSILADLRDAVDEDEDEDEEAETTL